MAIIGLLAGLMIINLAAARRKAQDAKRKADLATVQAALETYNDSNGYYPLTSSGSPPTTWDSCGSSPPTSWIPDPAPPAASLIPEFISILPLPPEGAGTSTNCPARYAYMSNGTDYKLYARGFNSNEGFGWSRQDGGAFTATISRNICGSDACPAGRTCSCDYELFTPGAQSW